MAPHAQITAQVVVVVLGAGVLHAVWNAMAKSIDDQLMAFALIGAATTIGGGVTLAVTGFPLRAAIPFAVGSAAIHIAYETGLMSAYRLGAFSQTYPIARGISPLTVAIGAYFLANERLPGLAVAGIVVLAAGLIGLAGSSGRLARADLPAVSAAVLTGFTIAGYTLVDGLGVRHAHSPYAYAGLLFVLQGPVFVLIAAARRPAGVWRPTPLMARGLAAGAITLLAYGIVLWAQTRAPLAEVAALRETSVISAALIGALFLKEHFGGRRLAAATLVATGIILISV